MSEKSVCRKCKYFNGFDGVGELWTGCHFGDFKGIKTSCNNFEKKITKADLLRRVSELEKENEFLRKEGQRRIRAIKLLRKQYSKIPPKIREVWKE